MEKELKIYIPPGYEIDREKSTFEKIIFKKVKNFHPKTWEEYHNLTKGEECYSIDDDDCVRLGYADEFSSKRRKEQYVALGKLLQLRDYWVRGHKEFKYAVLVTRDKNILVYNWSGYRTYPHILTFPTEKNAEDFKECFSDLIKKAFLLE